MTRRQQALATAVAIVAGVALGVSFWWLRSPDLAVVASTTNDGSAARLAGAIRAPVLAATRAGNRSIAVGEHGVVLLSDDDATTWRQAQAVPMQALLTSVSFVDAKQGWAAGHDGAILHTTDGGEHWTQQREDKASDKPLLSIRFSDASHGLAVGLFGLALRTEDGGATWTPFELIPGNTDDKHLYALFGNADVLCIAAEAGLVYRSTDGGATWAAIQTSNIGSFWTGAALADGSLMVAGQRGHVFRSSDQGQSWTEQAAGTQQSLTDVIQSPTGNVILSGLAGTMLQRAAGEDALAITTRADRLPLTAIVVDSKDQPHYFGSAGPVGK